MTRPRFERLTFLLFRDSTLLKINLYSFLYSWNPENDQMKTCTVLINKVWGGWYGHVAMFSTKWVLILGFGLAVFGIVLNYMENLAEIGTR